MRRRMQVAGGGKKAGNRWISGNFWPSGALYSQAEINLTASDAAPARSDLAAEQDFARGIITLKVNSAAAVFPWQMALVAGSDGATPGSVRSSTSRPHRHRRTWAHPWLVSCRAFAPPGMQGRGMARPLPRPMSARSLDPGGGRPHPIGHAARQHWVAQGPGLLIPTQKRPPVPPETDRRVREPAPPSW